jgi:glucose-6-phosphate-specific signal transduction histidine kinase
MSLGWDTEPSQRNTADHKTTTEMAITFHKDIKTTVTNIHILSEMATMKADKDLDRSKDYIKQISEKSNKMITSMDDILWSLHPANDTMKETVFRIRKFVDALQNKNNARIFISIDDRISSLKLEMKTRHELFIIIKSLLRMIVEEGGGKETQMNIDYNKSKLIVKMLSSDSVINNNEGTQQKKEDVKRRVQEINADIEIQTDHKGMSVILLVPV